MLTLSFIWAKNTLCHVLQGFIGFYGLQKDLGDRLLPCFKSPSNVPFSDVNLKTGHAHAPRWGPDSSTSEVTTIQLEFRDLSRITNDNRYEVCSNQSNWNCSTIFYFVFSSPELKAQVSFSDHLSSVVCLSVRPSVRPSVCLSVCL